MRIHSKFKDYYDTALSHGIDKTLHFVRKTETLERNKKTDDVFEKVEKVFNDIPLQQKYWRSDRTSFMPIVIFFCGKTYLVYHFEAKTSLDVKEDYFHKLEQLLEYEDIIEKTKKTKYKPWRPTLHFTQETISNIMKTINGQPHKLNVDLKTPIIVAKLKGSGYYGYKKDDIEIILNDSLRQYNFMKHADPYTAFQELSMFIGGVIGSPDPPMIKISEKDKIISKGFDPKYSFRKMPTKRKIK